MSRFVSVGECMIELSEAEGDLWRMGVAGDTLNTAWYARALLPARWKVDYVTRLGEDAFSRRAEAFIRSAGIGTGALPLHPVRSIGLYAISLASGERSFSYWRDSSAARTLADDMGALERATEGAAVLYLSGITLAILPARGRAGLIALLRRRRAQGALCVLDTNYRPRLWKSAAVARQAMTRAAAACQVVLPSFDDERALFGDATPEAVARRYARTGASTVVVKNGGGPLAVAEAGGVAETGGLPRVVPVDTTGAGDSFNAGFLAARLAGEGTEAAVRAAHALAARVIRHRGALIPMAELRGG